MIFTLVMRDVVFLFFFGVLLLLLLLWMLIDYLSIVLTFI